jgi:hypothetical protein
MGSIELNFGDSQVARTLPSEEKEFTCSQITWRVFHIYSSTTMLHNLHVISWRILGNFWATHQQCHWDRSDIGPSGERRLAGSAELESACSQYH